MQITNEAADVINDYLKQEAGETISSIEDAVQLNKEFNNKFDLDLCNHDLWYTLYESILLEWFNYFKYKIQSYNIILQYWYYDYLYRYDKWELQECIDRLTTEEQLQLMDDPICKYFIHQFSLDIKI